jgi:WD40 repeat protein
MFTRFLSVLLCLAGCPAFAVPPQNLNTPVARDILPYSQPWPSKDRVNKEIQPNHLRKVLELPAESRPITSLAVSPDNSLIAYTVDRLKRSLAGGLFHLFFSSNIDKALQAETTLKIWNKRTGQVQAIVKEETIDGFRALHFSADGKTLVTQGGFSFGVLKLWETETGKLLATLSGPKREMSMSAISHDGRLLAAGNLDGTARLWTVPDGELKATLGSYEKKKGSWLKRWAYPEQYEEPNEFVRLCFSPDSTLLAKLSGGKDAEVWDTATGQLKFSVQGSDQLSSFYWGGASDLFSPDRSILATTYTERDGAYHLTANSVKLWSAKDGSLLKTLEHARNPARFSPDGKKLVTGIVHWDDDGTWDFVGEIWNVETGELETRLLDPKGTLDEILWCPDGRTLATTGGGKYTLTLWDPQSGQQKAQIRLVRHHGFDIISDYISDQDEIFFSPDSRFLIAANSKSLRIIDVKTGTVLEKIEGMGLPVIFLSNGQLVTRSADKKSVVIWEITGN